jgi:hypothetical protein
LVEKIREGGFTGWTKNYLSAHEANFLPREWSDIWKGNIIIGTLLEAWNVVSDDI